MTGNCPRDVEIPLNGDPHEVHVIPREPVVHDVGADDLDQHERRLLGALTARAPCLAQSLDDPGNQPLVDLGLVTGHKGIGCLRPGSCSGVECHCGAQRQDWLSPVLVIILQQIDLLK